MQAFLYCNNNTSGLILIAQVNKDKSFQWFKVLKVLLNCKQKEAVALSQVTKLITQKENLHAPAFNTIIPEKLPLFET